MSGNWFHSLRRAVLAFREDRRGNIAVIFAILLVPLLGMVGAAIDYTRASTARQMLMSAVDSAALMAARDAAKLTDAQLKTRINDWISANLYGVDAGSFSGAKVTIDRTNRTIDISAEATVKTTMTQLVGPDGVTVSGTSQSTWGTNKIELALVLDNTGSMANNNKMTALKAAAKDLIQIMKDATTETDQIRISIVPFNTQVRIARTFQNEQWMRYGLSRKVICNGSGTSCTLDDYYRTPISDLDGLVCSGSGNKKTCTTQNLTKASWAKTSEGCITDRDKDYDYDVKDGGSYGVSGQQYPGYWCSQSSLAEALPLTSDWTALTNRVNSMTPAGATNVTIGAVWGWATLTPGAPYTEAKPATELRLKKYMILLTDGDNTQNRWDGNGSNPSPAVDARTKLACTNIKADGIGVYTIRVMDGNRDLLKSCASKDSMYYEVSDSSQLSPVFQAIAKEISQVRISM